jgi:ABC-type Fe3+/spermidine/putrescine transport system ATPase subunit
VSEPGADAEVVLELRDTVKRFGAVPAVAGVSFSVRAGEVFTLLGPSGCGKSTILRLVAGLEEPDQGEILINGRVVASSREKLCLPPERRNMGMVFQSYAIWPHFTVFDNVAFPLKLRKWPGQRMRERVAEVLEIVGLGGLADRPATNLSGGQQQRVALARALSYSPAILLLDEPLSNLDAKLREYMRVELHAIQRRLGISVLFVTHDQTEAMTMSDRIAVMNEGRFEQVGTPTEVYERPASPFVRDFLGRTLVFSGIAQRQGPAVVIECPDEGARLVFDDGLLGEYGEPQRVLVACRPEDVRVEPRGQAAPNRLPVVVQERTYLGDRVEYALRTERGRSLLVSSPRQDRYATGTALDLVIEPATATVWPE